LQRALEVERPLLAALRDQVRGFGIHEIGYRQCYAISPVATDGGEIGSRLNHSISRLFESLTARAWNGSRRFFLCPVESTSSAPLSTGLLMTILRCSLDSLSGWISSTTNYPISSRQAGVKATFAQLSVRFGTSSNGRCFLTSHGAPAARQRL